MSKDKKFKINLIEKSHQNFGNSSKSIKYSYKQKSLPQKSDKFKSVVVVHKKEEKITELKQFKVAEQSSGEGDIFKIKFSESSWYQVKCFLRTFS